jgi:hypothetical protein
MLTRLSQLSLGLVPVVLWAFAQNRTQYVHAATLMIVGIIVLNIIWSADAWKESVCFTGFWSSTLGVIWFLSERREGRDVAPLTMPLLLLISSVFFIGLFRIQFSDKKNIFVVGAMLLTYAVMYLSASAGGADHMKTFMDGWGIPGWLIEGGVKVFRKGVHISFYGALAWLVFRHWASYNRKGILEAFIFTLLIACCDEWRQSLMPNRGGSLADVVLDISAAAFVLWRCHVSVQRSTIPSP